MDVNGWVLVLALLFVMLFAGVFVLLVMIRTQNDYLIRTLIPLLRNLNPSQERAMTQRPTSTSTAQHRGEI